MPGDDVEITGEGKLFINGELVKDSMPLLRFNKKSPAEYAFKKRLGKDEYFFVGDHHDSFDSRYWGTVKGFELSGHGYALF
jgi:conjugal transfer pilin signal peptidase TrbI